MATLASVKVKTTKTQVDPATGGCVAEGPASDEIKGFFQASKSDLLYQQEQLQLRGVFEMISENRQK